MHIKHISVTTLLAVGCMVGLGAQSAQVERHSKIEVKNGKEVTLTGCVRRSASGAGFILTEAADKEGARHAYMLVTDDQDDLAKNVGHLVQIKGRAADRGDATVKSETETRMKVEGGEEKTTHAKSEVSGNLAGLPLLGVDSVKMLAGICR